MRRTAAALALFLALAPAASAPAEEGQAAAAEDAELGPAALAALRAPPETLAPAAAEDLDRAWRTVAEPILRAVLRGRDDEIWFEVAAARRPDGRPLLLFQARGLNARYALNPERAVTIEVLHGGGEAAIEARWGARIRASASPDFETGTEAACWRDGERLIEVRARRGLRSLETRVRKAAAEVGFARFPASAAAPPPGARFGLRLARAEGGLRIAGVRIGFPALPAGGPERGYLLLVSVADLERARTLAAEALARTPGDARVHREIAAGLRAAGAVAEARRALEEGIGRAGSPAPLVEDLAWLVAATEGRAAALAVLDRRLGGTAGTAERDRLAALRERIRGGAAAPLPPDAIPYLRPVAPCPAPAASSLRP